MNKKHYDLVKDQFKQQAAHFDQNGYPLSNSEYIQWALSYIDPQADDDILDVAAGTGHLSRALAPRVRKVIAIDVTPEMLQEGRSQAAMQGITNIDFSQGLAEKLPFPDNSFDIVSSRLAIHHFADPVPPLREMLRVCRRGGKVAVIDLFAPDNLLTADLYNHYERLRDPSHSRALSLQEMQSLFTSLGLSITQSFTRDVEMDLDAWLNLTKTPEDVCQIITKAIDDELNGHIQTGMRPYIKDGKRKFTHRWITLVGIK